MPSGCEVRWAQHRQSASGPHDDRGQRHTNRPFRQQPARERRAGHEQPLPAARIGSERPGGGEGDEGCPGRQGDEAGEHQIRQRLTGDRHVAEARRRDGARQQPGGLVVPPSGARVGGQHQDQTGHSRGDTRRQLADTGPQICERRQPVVEHRFLEPILAVVVRRDPVAARDHLACGLGVERLVGIGDRRSAESDEERQDAEEHQEGDARGRHAGIVYIWMTKTSSCGMPRLGMFGGCVGQDTSVEFCILLRWHGWWP